MKKLLKTGLALAAILLVSCQVDPLENGASNDVNAQQEIPASDLAALMDMGFDTQDIELDASGEYYIVEGDMAIEKASLADDLGKKQRYNKGRLVACWKVKDIKIKHYLPPHLASALENAVWHWNNTTGSFVNFRYVDDGQDITIYGDKEMKGSGLTDLPGAHGMPGRWIKINTRWTTPTWKQRRNTMIHELGHAIGIQHTKEKSGLFPGYSHHIPNTPHLDDAKYSMFNYSSPAWADEMSYWDKEAIKMLYSDRGDRLCDY